MLHERVAANQVYLVAWPIGWLSPLTDPPVVGRGLLGVARRQGEMTGQGSVANQRTGDGMVRNAPPTNCSQPLACILLSTSSLLIARRFPASADG